MTAPLRRRSCAMLAGAAVAGALWLPAAAQNGKKELAARVMALQQPGIENFSQALLREALAPLANSAAQALRTRVSDDRRDVAAKAVEAELRKFIDETRPLILERSPAAAAAAVGPILEQRFSEEELRQLIAWMESPVSRKFSQTQTELQRALGERLIADMRPLMEPRVRRLEQALARHLGMPLVASGASAAAAAGSAPSNPQAPRARARSPGP